MDVRAVLTRVMAIVAACGAGGASSATNAPRDRTVLAIPAGRLNMALRQLATQTGQQIVFDPAMVGRRTVAALHGPIDAERALKMLLSGSGLVARHLRPGVIIIVVAPPARPSDVSTAIAQVAAPDIVVTALKRPTALGDTEVSMDAVTGAQVSMRGAYDLRSAAALLPGLVPIATAPLQQRIAIRGVTGTGEATVGVYYGETPISGPSGTTFDSAASTPDIDLVDVERIELLRGPQGTLYGASSMGGTLRVLFNQPDATRWMGHVDAGTSVVQGGGMGGNIAAVLNAPIVRDTLAARIVVHRRTIGGYVDNDRLGIANTGGIVREGVRVGVGWTPSSTLRIDALALHQDTRIDDAGFWYPDLGRYRNDQPVRTPNRERLDLASVTAHWNPGEVTVVATGSHYRWTIVKEGDFTQVLARQATSEASCRRFAMLTGPTDCTPDQRSAFQAYLQTRLPGILYQPFHVESSTAELRLSSAGSGTLAWTIGAFVERRRDTAESYTVRADATSGLKAEPLDITGLRLLASALDQQALFAETSWAATPRLSATVGLRYFRYARTASGSVPIPNIITGTGAVGTGQYRRADDGTNLKAELAYRLPDETLVYVIASEGFRPGGVNITPDLTEQERSYDADHVWSYELGAKTKVAGGRLGLEGAVYHIDWSDTVYAASSANGAFVYNTNIGAVRIDGLEVKASLTLGAIRLTGSANYTDARLSKDQLLSTTDGAGKRGDPLPNVPRLAYGLGAQTSVVVAGGKVATFGVDAVGATRTPTAFNDLGSYYEETPARFVIDANADIRLTQWRAGIGIRNVLNAVGATRLTSSAFGERQLYSSAPRTLMLSIDRDF
jgi:iron complex outermembrane receptor protein